MSRATYTTQLATEDDRRVEFYHNGSGSIVMEVFDGHGEFLACVPGLDPDQLITAIRHAVANAEGGD